jgi:hypothetical protein
MNRYVTIVIERTGVTDMLPGLLVVRSVRRAGICDRIRAWWAGRRPLPVVEPNKASTRNVKLGVLLTDAQYAQISGHSLTGGAKTALELISRTNTL